MKAFLYPLVFSIFLGLLHPNFSEAHSLRKFVPATVQGKKLILELSFADFVRLSAVSDPMASFKPLNDAAVVKLQKQVTRLHEELKKKNPEQFANVPLPQVAVLESEVVNAYASTFATSFEVGVQVADPEATGNKKAEAMRFAAEENFVGVHAGTGMLEQMKANTVFLGKDWQILKDMIEVYRSDAVDFSPAKESCKVAFEKDAVSFRGKCLGDERSFTSASLLSVDFFSNWFVVTTGLLESASPEEVLAVVTHELAHYYRNQIVLPPSRRGYAYELDKAYTGLSPAPLKDPELVQLARRYLVLSELVPSYKNVQGSAYNRLVEVYFFERKLYERLAKNCKTEECKAAWKELNAFLANTDIGALEQLVDFSYEDCDCIQPIDRKLYLQSIELLMKAAKLTEISPNSPEKLSDIISRLPYEVEFLFSSELHAKGVWNFHELLSFYSQKYEETSKILEESKAKINGLGIGYYTYEQEADDISLELMSILGVNPQKAIDLFFNTNPNFTEESRQACHENWLSHWALPVPQGAWFSKHHDVCFRVYNIDSEIKAHRY